MGVSEWFESGKGLEASMSLFEVGLGPDGKSRVAMAWRLGGHRDRGSGMSGVTGVFWNVLKHQNVN